MQCPYCGYEYDDKELKCPFCGTENTEEARSQQKKTICSLEEEEHRIRFHLPKQMTRSVDRKAFRAGHLLLILVLVLTLAGILGNIMFGWIQKEMIQRNVQLLETYLENGDYEKLQAKMENLSWESEYDKYYQVCYAASFLDCAEQSLEWYYEEVNSSYSNEDSRNYYVTITIAYCMNVFLDTDPYISDDLVEGNEKALTDLHNRAWNILTLVLKMTEEEIQELQSIDTTYYGAEDTEDYAPLVRERIE